MKCSTLYRIGGILIHEMGQVVGQEELLLTIKRTRE